MYTDVEQLARDRAEAWRVLLEQRAKCLRPKDKDVTELDRKVLMDALCSQQEKDYLFLDSLFQIRMAGLHGPAQSREGMGLATPPGGS